MDLNNTPSTSTSTSLSDNQHLAQHHHQKNMDNTKYESVKSTGDDEVDCCNIIKPAPHNHHSSGNAKYHNLTDSSTLTDDTSDYYGRDNSTCSIITTSGTTKEITIVPTGLKVISMVSMLTAIVLTTASSILLYRSNTVLLAWLKAAPSTLEVLAQINSLFQGNANIVAEVQSQEKYLRTLIYCSAVLIATGMVQLVCNLWFFLKMNSSCTTRTLVKTEQFLCGM